MAVPIMPPQDMTLSAWRSPWSGDRIPDARSIAGGGSVEG